MKLFCVLSLLIGVNAYSFTEVRYFSASGSVVRGLWSATPHNIEVAKGLADKNAEEKCDGEVERVGEYLETSQPIHGGAFVQFLASAHYRCEES